MAANVKESSAVIGVVVLMVVVVAHGVDPVPKSIGSKGIVQSSLASDVGGGMYLIRVYVGEYIVKFQVCTDRGHQIGITAYFFIEIADDYNVAARIFVLPSALSVDHQCIVCVGWGM